MAGGVAELESCLTAAVAWRQLARTAAAAAHNGPVMQPEPDQAAELHTRSLETLETCLTGSVESGDPNIKLSNKYLYS